VVVYRPIHQMPRQTDTCRRILHAALNLFVTRGYHNTGIADILKASDCRRGTLYHYFSSKEALGFAVIDEWMRLFVEEGAASRLRTDEHPIDRLLRMLDAMPNIVKMGEEGRLIAGVSASMAITHPPFRQRVAAGLKPLVEEVEHMVRKGIEDGQIVDTVDPRRLAHIAAILAHGIQMATLLGQDEVVSEEARQWVRDYLNSLRRQDGQMDYPRRPD
jgi:TetR/AcrR family transcriptional repressor of nem operon